MAQKTNIIFLLTILVGCTSTNVITNDLTGQEIKHKYSKLQSFIYTFENEEQDGALTDTYVEIYKVNNQKCAIVGRTFGDSVVGGSETLIFFKNRKLLSATLRPFGILGLKDDGIKSTNPNEVAYSEPFPSDEVKSMLETSFNGYLKKLNKNTLSKC